MTDYPTSSSLWMFVVSVKIINLPMYIVNSMPGSTVKRMKALKMIKCNISGHLRRKLSGYFSGNFAGSLFDLFEKLSDLFLLPFS